MKDTTPGVWMRWLSATWWTVTLVGGAWVVFDLWNPGGLADSERSLRSTLLYRFGPEFLWWCAVPGFVWLRATLGTERPWWMLLAAHVLAAASATMAVIGLRVLLVLVANQLPPTFFGEVWSDFVHWPMATRQLWIYAMIALPIYATGFYRSWRAEQRGAAELKLANAQVETRLVRANLDALKMQLHPHFLFNALNSITALIRRGRTEEAEEAVAKLGILLRRALDHRQDQFLSLEREMEFLEHYFEIERIRFNDRLVVDLSAAPDCRGAKVPSLLLQPLVENAMKHGFARSPEARALRLSARREGDRLVLELYNDGPALPSGFSGEGSGIGLRNIHARLALLYGTDACLTLADVPGGVLARVVLPFQPADA